MNKITAFAASAITLLSATVAAANAAGCEVVNNCSPTAVPEINAYAGVAAVAALAAVVAMVWERRRHA